jgi:hypothetical protein
MRQSHPAKNSRLHGWIRLIAERFCWQVTVRPALHPAFVTEAGKEQFFARAGNSTRELSGREMLEYCKIRWPHD